MNMFDDFALFCFRLNLSIVIFCGSVHHELVRRAPLRRRCRNQRPLATPCQVIIYEQRLVVLAPGHCLLTSSSLELRKKLHITNKSGKLAREFRVAFKGEPDVAGPV